ncbi:MAG: hypothetical protein ACRDD1_04315, partial [Planctomycetia bacterium]
MATPLWTAWTVAVLLATAAHAHPLGEGKLDRGVVLRVTADAVEIDYDLQIGELTMVRQLAEWTDPGTTAIDPEAAVRQYETVAAPILARGLTLTVDGVPWVVAPTTVEHQRADHVRFVFHFRGAPPESTTSSQSGDRRIVVVDDNFETDGGYRRKAATTGPGAMLTATNAPTRFDDATPPADWELSPDEEVESRTVAVVARIDPSADPAPTVAAAPLEATAQPEQSLRELLAVEATTAGRWKWIGLLTAAFVMGMVHAFKPGHGKTMVAAYLVGENGTVYHALILGATTAVTHTGSVMIVALLLQPFARSAWLSQSMLAYVLSLVGGGLVFWLGAALFVRRWRGEEDLLHVHGPGGHVHRPDGGVDHLPAAKPAVGWRSLAALGFSGGLLPCDDAVALLIVAVSAG